MNNVIGDFVDEVFTYEMASLIKQAFSLFEAFEYQDAYSKMMDAVSNESVSDIASRIDHFTTALCNELDFVLNEHLIRLTEESTINDRVVILDALYRFQHLEDYTIYDGILEADGDEFDKMSEVLAELTSMDQAKFLTVLKTIDPRTISLMKVFIEDKNKNHTVPPISDQVRDRLRSMSEALGEDSLGILMMKAGMIIGLPIKSYLPYIQNNLVVPEDKEASAENILSIMFLSDVLQENLIAVYREIAEGLFTDLNEISQVESFIVKLLSKISTINGINHEKGRLLKESNTSRSG